MSMFKFPGVDEMFRSLQSLGDVITLKPERAANRWKNWTEDSFIAGFGKAAGHTVAAGACAIVGQSAAAKDQIKRAGNGGEQLGATSIATVTEALGVTSLVLTCGIPNPASGYCLGYAKAISTEIDKTAKEGGFTGDHHMDWDNAGKESLIGGVKGAVSCGGLIPFTGKAVEHGMRGKPYKDLKWSEADVNAELLGSAVNIATAAVSYGTGATMSGIIESGALSGAGTVAEAAATGGIGAALNGTRAAATAAAHTGINTKIRQQHVQKLQECGYTLTTENTNNDDGIAVDVYTHANGQKEEVPRTDWGNVFNAALVSATVGGATNSIKASIKVRGSSDTTGSTTGSSVRPSSDTTGPTRTGSTRYSDTTGSTRDSWATARSSSYNSARASSDTIGPTRTGSTRYSDTTGSTRDSWATARSSSYNSARASSDTIGPTRTGSFDDELADFQQYFDFKEGTAGFRCSAGGRASFQQYLQKVCEQCKKTMREDLKDVSKRYFNKVSEDLKEHFQIENLKNAPARAVLLYWLDMLDNNSEDLPPLPPLPPTYESMVFPKNRCYDVQWTPPGIPTLKTRHLSHPHGSPSDATGFSFRFHSDNGVSFHSQSGNGAPEVRVFERCEFVAISPDVLLFNGDGHATLIKGRGVPANSSGGEYHQCFRPNDVQQQLIAWLLVNFGT